MERWITNWPHRKKWGGCSAALAAQIAVEGRCQVMLVGDDVRLTRHILLTPRWAQTLAQRHPAVALALRISPLDRFRQARRMSA